MKTFSTLSLTLVLIGALAAPALGSPSAQTRDQLIARAKQAVSYSYWWGHGCWRTDGTQHGSCSGSCPSCTHSGSYGADCSGYAGKVWQVPSDSAVSTNSHPYSTYNFYNERTHWTKVTRANALKADCLVYNADGHGHITVYESGDPWGSMWLYEARGCSYGIVHNNRALSSSYIAIRRNNITASDPKGTVRGVVFVDHGSGTDDMSERLAGAAVKTSSGASTSSAADTGNWSFSLNAGSYTITASKSGYVTKSRTCSVTAGTETWCSIGLLRECTPNCSGKVCGPDGCGGSCGSCQADYACSAGACVCQPRCTGLSCGPDPVCGESCGSCPETDVCTDGQCICQPQCGALACGPDPVCGASCGACPEGWSCEAGACVAPCQPACGERVCGFDPVCGTSCGECARGSVCQQGACVDTGCLPECDAQACGPDPACGLSCGVCPVDQVCDGALACGPIDAEHGKLYGRVLVRTDENSDDPQAGQALAEAEIEIPDLALVQTDENGYWEALVAPGVYLVSARAEGYLESTASCTVSGGGYAECAFGLEIDADRRDADPDEIVIAGGCQTAGRTASGLLGWALLAALGLRRRRFG